jgi:hypothetical protein
MDLANFSLANVFDFQVLGIFLLFRFVLLLLWNAFKDKVVVSGRATTSNSVISGGASRIKTV